MSVGMGVWTGPIPAASLDRVAPGYGPEEATFRDCIRAMDAAYLAWARTKPEDRVSVSPERFGPQHMRGLGRG